jgi:hypothetical protein
MQCKPNNNPANSIRHAYSRYEYVYADIYAVTTESNILTLLCLFIQTSPVDFAVASGKGNRLFIGELHVQIANKLQSPQCHTEAELLSHSPLIFRYHLPLKRIRERYTVDHVVLLPILGGGMFT